MSMSENGSTTTTNWRIIAMFPLPKSHPTKSFFVLRQKFKICFVFHNHHWLMRYVNILLKVKLQTCYLTTFAKNISYLNMRVMPQARIFHFPPHTFHCFWWLTLFALPNNGHTVLLLKMFNVNVKRLFIGEKSTFTFSGGIRELAALSANYVRVIQKPLSSDWAFSWVLPFNTNSKRESLLFRPMQCQG